MEKELLDTIKPIVNYLKGIVPKRTKGVLTFCPLKDYCVTIVIDKSRRLHLIVAYKGEILPQETIKEHLGELQHG